MSNDDSSMQQMIAMAQVAEAQRRVIFTASHCFDQCVPSPGKELSSSQQKCIFRCAANFLETSVFMQKRLAKQSEMMQQTQGSLSGAE